MGKKIPASTSAAVIDMYVNQNMGVSGIARALRIGTTTALRELEKAGIERHRASRLSFQSGGKRFTDGMLKEIADRYAGGVTSSELQSAYDCSAATIRKAVQRNGGTMRPVGQPFRAFTPEQIDKMKALWDAGEPVGHIGLIMRAKGGVVANALALQGIKVVPRIARKERSNFWSGGRVITAQGYVWVSIGADDPLSSMRMSTGYVAEHRLVMARSLNRLLGSNESVHHINGDKTDNRIENLQLRQGKHGKHEAHLCRACGSYDIETVRIADTA